MFFILFSLLTFLSLTVPHDYFSQIQFHYILIFSSVLNGDEEQIG